MLYKIRQITLKEKRTTEESELPLYRWNTFALDYSIVYGYGSTKEESISEFNKNLESKIDVCKRGKVGFHEFNVHADDAYYRIYKRVVDGQCTNGVTEDVELKIYIIDVNAGK